MKARAGIPLQAAGRAPLCVDLDGTLVKTDLLVESLFVLLKKNPLALFQAIFWLLRGKAYLKHRIAMQSEIEADLLPYDQSLLKRLRIEKENGRTLILVTASHRKFADAVASHLSLFDEVHATESSVNLSAKRKRDYLVEKFGRRGFDYVGNAGADITVWASARESWLVDTSCLVHRAAANVAVITTEFRNEGHYLAALVKGMRMHQWVKNVLVFIPLITSHKINQISLVADAFLAFLVFGLCASSVYLLNDLLDLPADRRHSRKRHRPFASGTLPVNHGLLLIPVLLAAATLLALIFLPLAFLAVLGTYYAVTLAYSFWAKERVVVDILCLAGLYTIRLFAGATATSIEPSFWLLAFSVFMFLSLALVKRYSEMLCARQAGQNKTSGRGYQTEDMPLLQSMGTSSGYMAVLVLALYINSSDVRPLYEHPMLLWALCPLLLFWISRVWMKTCRGEMHYDPVVFAVKDRVSQLTGLISGAVLVLGA